MNEEVKFEDADTYSSNYGQDKLSFRDIILQHLKSIGKYSSVEFRGGYWETRSRPMGSGVIQEEYYVPDSREVYSNAVEYLSDTLYPYFDKEMLEAEEKSKKEIEEAYENYTSVTKDEYKEVRKWIDESSKLAYRTFRRTSNRFLFRALCSFLYRKKYLELGSIED